MEHVSLGENGVFSYQKAGEIALDLSFLQITKIVLLKPLLLMK